ncbi:MAG TPA: hypothetical protein VGN75_10230 [Kaistia sp.]|nr:hypothetical protein [Kaistia sp.]
MTSAKERAVEAGARELSRRDMGDEDYWEAFTEDAKSTLRVTFPILAEDLVAWHDEQAAMYEADDLTVMAEFHRDCARALRARIQQMAEAL